MGPITINLSVQILVENEKNDLQTEKLKVILSHFHQGLEQYPFPKQFLNIILITLSKGILVYKIMTPKHAT